MELNNCPLLGAACVLLNVCNWVFAVAAWHDEPTSAHGQRRSKPEWQLVVKADGPTCGCNKATGVVPAGMRELTRDNSRAPSANALLLLACWAL